MKGKILVWILVLLIAIGFTNRVQILSFLQSNKKEINEITMAFDTKDVSVPNAYIGNKKYNNIKFTVLDSLQSKESADVIIRDHSTDLVEGYNIYPEKLYSPFVLISEYNSVLNGNLTEVDASASGYTTVAYEQNMKVVLDALNNGGTISDIGLLDESKKKDTKLNVYIPNENSPYYEDIVKFLYISYYDTPMTEENFEERQIFINSILDKCTKVNNIVKFSQEKIKDGIVIIPEYILFLNYYDIFSNNKNMAIYPSRTNYVAYDILIKKDLSNDNLESKIIETFETNKKLYKLTYIRVQNRTYSEIKESPLSRMVEHLNMVSEDNFFLNDFNFIEKNTKKEIIPTEKTEQVKNEVENIETTQKNLQEETEKETEEEIQEETQEEKEETNDENTDIFVIRVWILLIGFIISAFVLAIYLLS